MSYLATPPTDTIGGDPSARSCKQLSHTHIEPPKAKASLCPSGTTTPCLPVNHKVSTSMTTINKDTFIVHLIGNSYSTLQSLENHINSEGIGTDTSERALFYVSIYFSSPSNFKTHNLPAFLRKLCDDPQVISQGVRLGTAYLKYVAINPRFKAH